MKSSADESLLPTSGCKTLANLRRRLWMKYVESRKESYPNGTNSVICLNKQIKGSQQTGGGGVHGTGDPGNLHRLRRQFRLSHAHTALRRCILSAIRTQGPKPKYLKEQLQTPLLQYFEENLPHLNREIWAN
ncbi:hypothetical protein L2E82_36169 [Cichorium intybus]|uniref:Uncharacterized protein n=1 Tax=Cichorium intybus TaxID=13427 RepID=A0ACB9BQW7_CICIN|nr:hypothetical protein L2E82_36169 [Cichorium intybus]